ncbi:hypothetical protein K3R08_003994 [Escherichia albertii]|nr:hypothetical protein [Escherichia albertii]
MFVILKRLFALQLSRHPIIYSANLPSVATASVVRGDIPYQTYRDFAKNKGQLHAGATNIPIFNQALIRINMSQMGFKLCRQSSLS